MVTFGIQNGEIEGVHIEGVRYARTERGENMIIGLKRKAINALTSLNYLKRKAKQEILASWKQEWKNTRQAEKGKAYTTATRDRPRVSYKMQPLAGPKRAQAAYYQLKLGKDFFKQFSQAIGKDDKGEYFGDCNSLPA
jgi:hypothetical protein